MQETFWDGKVHTNPMDCLTNGDICHDNGKLVSAGNGQAWQSDPAKNNKPGEKLKSATWYGPYNYSSGPYQAYGFGISGQQNVCFNIKDLTTGSARAKVTFEIDNAAAYGQEAKTLLIQTGVLAKEYKKGFQPICIPFSNPYNAYAQQYRLFVNTGTVQVDYVDHFIQYYTYDYNPYPYPYDYVIQAMRNQVPAGEHFQAGVICSAALKKSTSQCLSQDDMNAASASKAMTNVQTNPAGVSAD